MEMNPYLTFDGSCEEALSFYAEALGGKVYDLSRFGEMPGNDIPEEMKTRVMHAKLKLGDKVLMASDSAGHDGPFNGHEGFTLQLGFDTVDEARRTFERLAEGGSVTMAFQETFWAAGFGMCRDRFGVPWMVNCDRPQDAAPSGPAGD